MDRVGDRRRDGDDRRRNNVGFALQILQRRLASSPAAIHESLRRRRERLETRLAETRLIARGSAIEEMRLPPDDVRVEIDPDELEEAPEEEIESIEETVLDRATAAVAKADAYNDEMAVRLQVAKANEARAVDELAATRKALAAPLGTPPLRDLAGPGKKVVIGFPDRVKGGAHPASHRRVAIPLIVEELLAGGTRLEDITLLCAMGLHRKNTLEEWYWYLGRDIVDLAYTRV